MTASEVIEAARDFHADFVKEAIPDRVALRQLERLENRIYRAMADVAPERLASIDTIDSAEIATALAASPPGHALPAHTLFVSAVAVDEDGAHVPVSVIAKADVPYRPSAQLGAYLEGDRFVLIDDRWFNEDTHGWEDITSIIVTIVPVPTPLSAVSDTLTIPDEAEDALVLQLASFFGRRLNLTKELPGLQEEADLALASLLDSTDSRDSTTSWAVRIV